VRAALGLTLLGHGVAQQRVFRHFGAEWLRIEPMWFEDWWLWRLAILAGAAAVWGIAMWKRQLSRRRGRELEHVVRQRAAELETANAKVLEEKERADEAAPIVSRAGGNAAAAASRTAIPVFDRAGLLERLMGDHELAERVLGVFCADVPRQIQALKESLEKGDAPVSQRHAHSIKGAAANVGGERLRAVAFEMEKAGADGDLGAAKGRMAELEAEFRRLCETVEEQGMQPETIGAVQPEGETPLRRGFVAPGGMVVS